MLVQDAALNAWKGASLFGASPAYRQAAVTKAAYEEQGGARLGAGGGSEQQWY